MRDILFRGKRKNNGKWIEGYYAMFDPVDIPDKIRKLKAVIFPGNAKCNWWNKYFYNAIEVLPDTVGQFTGLTDKNGKMIFEGDLLSVIRGDVMAGKMYPRRTDIGVVEYCKDRFLMKVGYKYEDIRPLKYIEVIGNVYDNPELLKGEVL